MMLDDTIKLYILFFQTFSYITHIFLNYKIKVIDLTRFNDFILFLEYLDLGLYHLLIS